MVARGTVAAFLLAACGSGNSPSTTNPVKPPLVATAAAPVSDAGTAAIAADAEVDDDPLPPQVKVSHVDGARFGLKGSIDDYRFGELHVFVMPAVPAADAATLARQVRSRGAFAMTLEPDRDGKMPVREMVNRVAESIQDGIPSPTSKLTLAQALDERTRALTKISDDQVRVLRDAKIDATWAQANRPAAVEQELRQIKKLPASPPTTEEALRVGDATRLANRNAERAQLDQPPITTMALVILEVPDTVALQLVLDVDDDLRPTMPEAMAVLASWHERYDARFVGENLTVEVLRPPHTLAEARRAALELYLMCPAHPDGYATHRPSGDDLLDQVTSTYWECHWFVE